MLSIASDPSPGPSGSTKINTMYLIAHPTCVSKSLKKFAMIWRGLYNRWTDRWRQLNSFFIPCHFKKCGRIMSYPPFKKLRSSVCLSVCMSVRPSAHHFHSLLGTFLTNFLKDGLPLGWSCELSSNCILRVSCQYPGSALYGKTFVNSA